MQRLALVEALDEYVPQWRSMIGEAGRDGCLVGWLDFTTPPAGALLADFADGENRKDAEALPWQDNGKYYLLRPPEAPEVWTRRHAEPQCGHTWVAALAET